MMKLFRRRPREDYVPNHVRIAKLECELEICPHMRRPNPHPLLLQSQNGRRYWRYEDGVITPERTA